MRIMEGVMPLSAVLEKAREMETTVTALLSGILLVAIAGELPARAKKRPVVLDIPVNLRKYFDSASARNFFSVVNVGYDFSRGSGELMPVVRKVRAVSYTHLDVYKRQKLPKPSSQELQTNKTPLCAFAALLIMNLTAIIKIARLAVSSPTPGQ